jgi:hypothetical protein
MGTGASISASDVPDTLTADVAEQLMGTMMWRTSGRPFFVASSADGTVTRDQFVAFVQAQREKSAEEGAADGGSGGASPSRTKKKKQKKKSASAEGAVLTEADMLRKLERKKRRKLMRIQKTKAARELLATTGDDAAAAEAVRKQCVHARSLCLLCNGRPPRR